MTEFQISTISEELSEHNKNVINDILEKGESFYNIDKNTPQTYRDKFTYKS